MPNKTSPVNEFSTMDPRYCSSFAPKEATKSATSRADHPFTCNHTNDKIQTQTEKDEWWGGRLVGSRTWSRGFGRAGEGARWSLRRGCLRSLSRSRSRPGPRLEPSDAFASANICRSPKHAQVAAAAMGPFEQMAIGEGPEVAADEAAVVGRGRGTSARPPAALEPSCGAPGAANELGCKCGLGGLADAGGGGVGWARGGCGRWADGGC